MTSTIRAVVALVFTLACPASTPAQSGGGSCDFSGTLTFAPPVGLVPSVCQSPAGCDRFSLEGSLEGPACSGFDGRVSSRRGLVFGAHGCEGNVHGGVLDHTRSSAPFSILGVCVAGACSGGGYATFGTLQYDLVVNPEAAAAVAGKCAAGGVARWPMIGVMSGAATN